MQGKQVPKKHSHKDFRSSRYHYESVLEITSKTNSVQEEYFNLEKMPLLPSPPPTPPPHFYLFIFF